MTTFTLYGPCPSKKNSRVNTSSGRSYPSAAYTAWLAPARQFVAIAHKGAPYEEQVKVEVEMHGLMNDVDNACSSLLDMMEGIIYLNDRQVISLRVDKYKAKKADKRCVVRCWEIPGE